MKHKIRHLLGILIAGALLFFLIKPFVETHTQLKDITVQIQWRWLLPSFGLLLLYRSAYTYPFKTLLNGITQNQVPFRTAFTLFHLANITRYLPGRIWGFVRLLSLSQRFRLSKTAVGSSLTLHVGIETALGSLIALSLLFSPQLRRTAVQFVMENFSGQTLIFMLLLGGFIVGLLVLMQSLSSRARDFLSTLQQTGQPLFHTHFLKKWWGILAGHVLLWLCLGGAFFLFVRSLTPVPWRQAFLFSACYAFAWLCGFLSFLTPGGLGVRESLLTLLLSLYIPPSQATLVALLCRVWMLSAELVLAGIASLLQKRK